MFSHSPPAFLTSLFSSYASKVPFNRPSVTLTFAQSIDAKIGVPSQGQLILSGQESMVMTHWMRTMHDAILIGIGTALNDNPQLNVRHLPSPAPTSPSHHLPIPIILDTSLKLSPSCKLLRNYQAGTGRRPWVVCSSSKSYQPVETLQSRDARKQALISAGAKIIEIDLLPPSETPQPKYLPIPQLLETLYSNGITSLMVEGGARIIESFLRETETVDKLVVTIAPVFVGDVGISYRFPSNPTGQNEQVFKEVHTESFGKDTVIALAAAGEESVGSHIRNKNES